MASITDRIDNVTKIPSRYLHAKLPAPKSVKIEISPRCNYRCGFCALRTREVQPKWDMDFGLFKRVTREMREAGVEDVGVFYLGESFMNPRLLVDCIAYLKRELAMPYVFLTSNASMAFPEAVDECMKAGLDSLKWSMNASDKEQFEKIMGVAGKLFYTALDNVKSAWDVRKSGGYKTGLYASSIKYDGDQQVKMEALLNESACGRSSTSITGWRCIRWAHSRRSASTTSDTVPLPAIRAASAHCANRCPAGPRSPKDTSRRKAACPPAASTRRRTGRWAT
jgi:uncharacterized Fe-S cluster-containing radical SAM superfamily protein